MPSLTPEDQDRLLGEQTWTCSKCGKHPYKNYCRECDEFFYVCECRDKPPEERHEGHRTY